ncbi:MAG TPA: hypothetical protein VE046_14785 [Steroidobacteraceae bacterium]|nr:hypothetical protein [Steroidobacteraceae bacterium]
MLFGDVLTMDDASVGREDIKVERGWLHCSTAQVSRTEHRTVTIARIDHGG